jgi:hypothetical protein
MAESRSILSEENQPTVIVVCFVLALLATGLGVYDMLQTRGLSVAVQRVSNVNTDMINSELSAATVRLTDLEKRLAALEQAAAATTTVAEGEAPAGRAGKARTP